MSGGEIVGFADVVIGVAEFAVDGVEGADEFDGRSPWEASKARAEMAVVMVV